MHFGVVLNFLGRTVLQHAAVVHHSDALGYTECDIEIVLDQNKTEMARQCSECDEFAALGGEVRRRLANRSSEAPRPRIPN